LPKKVYWEDLPQEEMNEIIREGEEKGGDDGLAQSLGQIRPGLYAHTYDPRRADWRFCLKTSNQGIVLDAGCGLGALSIPLAKDNLGVLSLDSTHERVKFVKIRCQQEGIHNVQPVCASVLSLPFPEDYFNVVVVNAVLELSPFLSLPSHDLINLFVHYRALAEKRKKFMERDLKDEDITSLFLEGNKTNPFLEYLRGYFLTMKMHPYFILPILYVRYPKIYLDERIGGRIVEVLSAD